MANEVIYLQECQALEVWKWLLGNEFSNKQKDVVWMVCVGCL